MKRKGKFFAVAALAFALLHGCGYARAPDPLPEPRLEFNRAAFDSARLDWESRGITDYAFTVAEFPGFPQPLFRVTVKNGEVADIARI
ncbi:MAG: hypothetical protein FWE09_08040, partial [Treponema sp.]|nr:hypothetical protein [Treponema sp.]